MKRRFGSTKKKIVKIRNIEKSLVRCVSYDRASNNVCYKVRKRNEKSKSPKKKYLGRGGLKKTEVAARPPFSCLTNCPWFFFSKCRRLGLLQWWGYKGKKKKAKRCNKSQSSHGRCGLFGGGEGKWLLPPPFRSHFTCLIFSLSEFALLLFFFQSVFVSLLSTKRPGEGIGCASFFSSFFFFFFKESL